MTNNLFTYEPKTPADLDRHLNLLLAYMGDDYKATPEETARLLELQKRQRSLKKLTRAIADEITFATDSGNKERILRALCALTSIAPPQAFLSEEVAPGKEIRALGQALTALQDDEGVTR